AKRDERSRPAVFQLVQLPVLAFRVRAAARHFSLNGGTMRSLSPRLMTTALLVVCGCVAAARAQDPLPSWNDGQAKQGIVNFVAKVTTEGSPDFVPVAQRIA